MEWSRLFLFTGFPWNPAGLALEGNRYTLQFAALFGVYGLSFWVILTNLSALRFFLNPTWQKAAVWASLVLFPYGFGVLNEMIAKKSDLHKELFQVAVVETGLFVEEKNRDRWKPDLFIPPLKQWERIFSFLNVEEPLDLIVLPEAALPFGFDRPFCPFDVFEKKWKKIFGQKSISDFPPLILPYAHLNENRWMISNAFIAQSLANHFHADLIVGLDHDEAGRKTNAAFFFRKGEINPERYDKRILVPVGEYIPLGGIKILSEFLASHFGIEGSFATGSEAKVFKAKHPIGIAICLEEMYGNLIRDLRGKGAKLIVTLSNDVWFPFSQLATEHFDHARVRAVENGLFLLRSSNMGITGGVDCFGQPIQISFPGDAGAVFLSIPLFSYPTLYSWCGDVAILFLSLLFIAMILTKKLLINEGVR
ncbi:MAG: apolipoprotein N-acyltransferase [Chlamydiae bacterium]|nr:apolipoprotein N-acyltransferase [Chlamydiota bacterium]